MQLSGGTFSVAFGGNGSANTVSRSDHTHDAAHLTSGLLPDERLGGTYTSLLNFNNPANVFAGSASALTDLNASALTFGTLPSARLAGTYSSQVTLTHAGNSFSGSGAGLTGLNANQLASGIVPESRLSLSVALLHLNQAYSGIPMFNGGVSGSTPPFSVDSTTLVPNLNADLLDGLNASAFAAAAHHHDNAYWKRAGNAGTVPGTDFLGTTDNVAGAVLGSTNNNSMTLRAVGGFRLFTDSGATTGARLAAGGGSWTSMSDRNAKENFAPVNPREILDKVAALPVQNWNYKSQPAETRHIGPTAQDFKAAFGVGESDTGITAVDTDGVALAAIQGLNQKLEEERRQSAARLERLEAENAGLRQALRELTERLDRRVPGSR